MWMIWLLVVCICIQTKEDYIGKLIANGTLIASMWIMTYEQNVSFASSGDFPGLDLDRPKYNLIWLYPGSSSLNLAWVREFDFLWILRLGYEELAELVGYDCWIRICCSQLKIDLLGINFGCDHTKSTLITFSVWIL